MGIYICVCVCIYKYIHVCVCIYIHNYYTHMRYINKKLFCKRLVVINLYATLLTV